VIRPIVTAPDAALTTVSMSVDVTTQPDWSLIQDLTDTMKAAHGKGLAAVQIGVHKRLAVMTDESGQLLVFGNPQFLARAGEHNVQEGCLSVPGAVGIVNRSRSVTVMFYEPSGNGWFLRERTFDGFDAQAMQHEVDHMEGRLYIERLKIEDQKRIINKARKWKMRGYNYPQGARV
jgi:peptide deformylase